MRDLKKYWAEVRTLESSLPDPVWLAMAGDPDGATLVEVPRAAAARFLQGGSHRRATEHEIALHRAQQEARRRELFHDDLYRRGIAVVPLSARPTKPAKPRV